MTAGGRRSRGRGTPWHERPWLVAAAALTAATLVVAALVVWLPRADPPVPSADERSDNHSDRATAQCPAAPVRVAVVAAAVDPVGTALGDQGCTTVEVVEATSGEATEGATIVGPLAVTPVVLVGVTEAPDDWRTALALDGLVLDDPTRDRVAAAALAAALADPNPDDRSDQVIRQHLADAGDRAGPVRVRTEQEALASGEEYVVPASGTVTVGLEAALVSGEAAGLAELLTSAPVGDALLAAGFRVGDRVPDGGQAELRVSSLPDGAVAEARAAWTALAVPIRALAVIDVSGSMAFEAGEGTRMELTIAATERGLDLFGDDAAVGLWSFSHEVGNNGGARAELVPVAPLGEGEQRTRLREALAGLPARIGGATTLYETTLAAYAAALEGYDPDASNSVLLFSDGSNEDPFSISQDAMIAQLEELRDPQRPVRIITIGISADADAEALARIADATGGASFVAERPDEIAGVFADAIATRTR